MDVSQILYCSVSSVSLARVVCSVARGDVFVVVVIAGPQDELQDVMASIQTGLAKGLKMGDRQVRRAAYHNLQVSSLVRIAICRLCLCVFS